MQPDQVKGHSVPEQKPLQWNPPDFQHLFIPEASYDGTHRYPLCDRQPPDRLHF